MMAQIENRQTGRGGGASFDYPPIGSYGIGDRIKFRAATRWSDKAVIRKIVAIGDDGKPEVRFGGWSNFVVRPHEVIAVVR
jgi:hypothetical protein